MTERLSCYVNDVFLARVFPACVFGVLLVVQFLALSSQLRASGGPASPLAWAAVAQRLGAICFLDLVIVLYLVRHPVRGRRSGATGAVVALGGTFLMSVPIASLTSDQSAWQLYVSAALILAGSLWSLASLVSLGRCFGLFPEARGLVTRGPYRLVRHPLYVGEAISTLGFVVGNPSPLLVGLYALQCCLQVWRAVNEERALRQIFPEYEDYSRQTARFLPGVY